MILIGVTCTYLAIVITGVSMLEILIKFIEFVMQKVGSDHPAPQENAP